MIVVSDKLKAAIKLNAEPAYKIAHQANIAPSTLSKLICGIEKIKHGDPRVVAIGKILGIPLDECFAEDIPRWMVGQK